MPQAKKTVIIYLRTGNALQVYIETHEVARLLNNLNNLGQMPYQIQSSDCDITVGAGGVRRHRMYLRMVDVQAVTEEV